MEVDERPTEQYSDIGGLDKQIQEVQKLLMTSELSKKRLVTRNHWTECELAIAEFRVVRWELLLDVACFIFTVDRSSCTAHDAQGAIRVPRNSATERSVCADFSRSRCHFIFFFPKTLQNTKKHCS